MEKSLSLLLSLLLCIFILPLSGCGTDSDMYIPEDSSKRLTISPDRLNVDWDLAIASAVQEDSDFSSYVENADIFIDGTSITFDIAVSPNSPHYYMDNVCSLMRALNEAAMLQDKRIPSFGEFSLGGIYDVFGTTVIVYTPDNEANTDSWYINDVLAPGEHRKRLPQPLDGSPAVPLNIVCSQLEGIFQPVNYPLLERAGAFVAYPPSFLMQTDSIEISLLMSLNKDSSHNDLYSYSDALLRTICAIANRWDSRLKLGNDNEYGEFLTTYSLYFISSIANSNDGYYVTSLPGEIVQLKDN